MLRTERDGRKSSAPEHPLLRILNNRINPESTPHSVWQTLVCHTLLYGNGYAEIVKAPNGRAAELYNIEPQRVTPVRDYDGMLEYRITQAEGAQIHVRPDSILHLRNLSPNAIYGYALGDVGSRNLGANMVVEEWTKNYFRNAMAPTGVIRVPPEVDLSPSSVRDLQEAFAAMAGPKGASKHSLPGRAWITSPYPTRRNRLSFWRRGGF